MQNTKKNAAGPATAWLLSNGDQGIKGSDLNARIVEYFLPVTILISG
jgi:hypothetical protein